MAAAVRTRSSYTPVSLEDNNSSSGHGQGSDRLIRAESRTSVTTKKPTLNVWLILLMFVGLCVIFLLGFCLGFYVRESQTENTVDEILSNCGRRPKSDLDSLDTLAKVHDDVMYRIRGESIRQFMQNFSSGAQHQDPVSGSPGEHRLEQAVRQSLQEFALDGLKVEEYDMPYTACDPAQPNILQVIRKDTDTNDVINITLRNDVDGDVRAASHLLTDDFKFPYVVHSPAGEVEGSVVYGHYGSDADLLSLGAKRVNLRNRIVLLRLGSVSLAEKVQRVADKGAVGVLVYWDPADADDNAAYPANTSYVPYASAAVYSSELSNPLVPSVPVQTISTDLAAMLLHRLQGEDDSIAAPSVWKGGLGLDYTMGRRSANGGKLFVRLTTYNQQKHHFVRNIISDIHGTEEKDRYVLIGAPRTSLPAASEDAVTSSALLVQVARSLHAAHQLRHWKPRRGIKMISWGAADLGNLGMLHYLKTHHHLLTQRAVAYIDVRQLVLGTDVLTARVSPGLYQVINEVTMTVPDPGRTEHSIRSSWEERYEEGQIKDPVIVPLSSYHSDRSATPFLHSVGVTTLSMQYRARAHSQVNALTVSSVDDYEEKHHYKYHTAVLRVMMQVMLSMADDDIIPYSLTGAARELTSVLWETSDTLDDCSNSMHDLDTVVTLSKELLQTAEVFNELISLFRQREDAQGFRQVNDVKMLFERIFLTHTNGVPHHALYPVDGGGVMTAVTQLCKAGDHEDVWDAADRLTDTLTLVMTEAINALRTTN